MSKFARTKFYWSRAAHRNPAYALMALLPIVLYSSTAFSQAMNIPGTERIPIETYKRGTTVGKADSGNPLGEDIDLLSGNLGFTHTDLELKGNGPDIRIARSFSVSKNAHYYNHSQHYGAVQDWELELPRIETSLLATNATDSLWKADGPDPSRRCSNFGYPKPISIHPKFWWRGVRLIIPGESAQVLLKRDSGYTLAPGGQTATYPVVTNKNWALSCLTQTANIDGGEGFLAVSPNGEKYWFNWYTEENFGDIGQYNDYPVPGPPNTPSFGMHTAGIIEVRLKVTRVEDRFGNYVAYSYTGRDLTGVSASDGRYVNLQYELMGAGGVRPFTRLTTVAYASGPNVTARTITYEHEDVMLYSPTRVERNLKKVVYPDGSFWLMNLRPVTGICDSTGPIPGGPYDFECDRSSYYGGIDVTPTYATITSPSGLEGTYIVGAGYVSRWAENCPQYGRQGQSCLIYYVEPPTSPAFRLQRKYYNGAGLPENENEWAYRYVDNSVAPLAIVTNPDGTQDVYRFGAYDKHSANEGSLLAEYKDAVMSGDSVTSAKRVTSHEYSQGRKVGTAPQYYVNRKQTEYFRGISKNVIRQNGKEFVQQVTGWDDLHRPTTVVKYNVQVE